MGKKRIVSGKEEGTSEDGSKIVPVKSSKKRQYATGILHIQSTYNNTKVMLSDPNGNALAWSSSGSIGFKGAKKGTPFASSKVGELMAERALAVGIKEVSVMINGVGAGRESALRTFAAKGLGIISISDITPIPHNGPRSPRARRV